MVGKNEKDKGFYVKADEDQEKPAAAKPRSARRHIGGKPKTGKKNPRMTKQLQTPRFDAEEKDAQHEVEEVQREEKDDQR